MLPIEIDKFIEFNKRNFPKRKNNSAGTLIDWRIKSNPYYSSFDSGLLCIHDSKLIGQIIPIYSKFMTNNNEYNCVWGSDYIVDVAYRGGNAGVKVIRNIIRKNLHFGVGMTDISLKIHKIFKEKCVGTRYDCLVFSTKKANSMFKMVDIDFFLKNFNAIFLQCYSNTSYDFFIRSLDFYNWIFQITDKDKLKVVWDEETKDFAIFYRSSYLGIPITKVIDFSPRINEQPHKLVEMIRFYLRESNSSKLIFYSGGVDLSIYMKSYRTKTFPIYSNIEDHLKGVTIKNRVHITGLDSDRFISEFL
jgi:hypothetical protein